MHLSAQSLFKDRYVVEFLNLPDAMPKPIFMTGWSGSRETPALRARERRRIDNPVIPAEAGIQTFSHEATCRLHAGQPT
jgi:hypothetical protein